MRKRNLSWKALTVLDTVAEADAIENAVLKAGYRYGDIARRGEAVIGCKEMGRRIREAL